MQAPPCHTRGRAVDSHSAAPARPRGHEARGEVEAMEGEEGCGPARLGDGQPCRPRTRACSHPALRWGRERVAAPEGTAQELGPGTTLTEELPADGQGVLARGWPRAAERPLFSEAEGLPGSFSHCNLLGPCSPFLHSLQDLPWRRKQATVVLGGHILPLRPVSRARGAADETPRSGGTSQPVLPVPHLRSGGTSWPVLPAPIQGRGDKFFLPTPVQGQGGPVGPSRPHLRAGGPVGFVPTPIAPLHLPSGLLRL